MNRIKIIIEADHGTTQQRHTTEATFDGTVCMSTACPRRITVTYSESTR